MAARNPWDKAVGFSSGATRMEEVEEEEEGLVEEVWEEEVVVLEEEEVDTEEDSHHHNPHRGENKELNQMDDKPLSVPMITHFSDAYVHHQGLFSVYWSE